jgi:hypothetical protein
MNSKFALCLTTTFVFLGLLVPQSAWSQSDETGDRTPIGVVFENSVTFDRLALYCVSKVESVTPFGDKEWVCDKFQILKSNRNLNKEFGYEAVSPRLDLVNIRDIKNKVILPKNHEKFFRYAKWWCEGVLIADELKQGWQVGDSPYGKCWLPFVGFIGGAGTVFVVGDLVTAPVRFVVRGFKNGAKSKQMKQIRNQLHSLFYGLPSQYRTISGSKFERLEWAIRNPSGAERK